MEENEGEKSLDTIALQFDDKTTFIRTFLSITTIMAGLQLMNLPIAILTFHWCLSVFIIIRHDKSDADYQQLSRQFEKNICHLNLGKNVPDGEGTVIHPNWILTAAHCAIDAQKKLDKNEEHFVTIMNVRHKVDKVIIHERWTENPAYDIALIHITVKSETADPVNIYNGNDELNKLVYVVGLGDMGDGKNGIKGNDGKLRAATNKVDEATDFWLKWRFDNPETNPDRATEFEGISGPGDSGGPALIRKDDKLYIVGISSGQSTRNTNGKEGVYGVIEYYTRVSKYVDWIKEKMK
jgi:hypothetical protein